MTVESELMDHILHLEAELEHYEDERIKSQALLRKVDERFATERVKNDILVEALKRVRDHIGTALGNMDTGFIGEADDDLNYALSEIDRAL